MEQDNEKVLYENSNIKESRMYFDEFMAISTDEISKSLDEKNITDNYNNNNFSPEKEQIKDNEEDEHIISDKKPFETLKKHGSKNKIAKSSEKKITESLKKLNFNNESLLNVQKAETPVIDYNFKYKINRHIIQLKNEIKPTSIKLIEKEIVTFEKKPAEKIVEEEIYFNKNDYESVYEVEYVQTEHERKKNKFKSFFKRAFNF